jgi:Fur family peroxide stress response transcriptional regulator
LVCNRVDDIYGVDESAYVNQISEKTAYRLSGQQFYFYGVCPECQSKAGKMH